MSDELLNLNKEINKTLKTLRQRSSEEIFCVDSIDDILYFDTLNIFKELLESFDVDVNNLHTPDFYFFVVSENTLKGSEERKRYIFLKIKKEVIEKFKNKILQYPHYFFHEKEYNFTKYDVSGNNLYFFNKMFSSHINTCVLSVFTGNQLLFAYLKFYTKNIKQIRIPKIDVMAVKLSLDSFF